MCRRMGVRRAILGERAQRVAADRERGDHAGFTGDEQAVSHGIEVEDVGVITHGVGADDSPGVEVEDAQGRVLLPRYIERVVQPVEGEAMGDDPPRGRAPDRRPRG